VVRFLPARIALAFLRVMLAEMKRTPLFRE
jgi:hypothetical protein